VIPVTAADIRSWSKVDFDDLIGPVPQTGPDPLQEEVDRQAALVQLEVGWFYDTQYLPPSPLFTSNPGLWVIPVFYEPLMRKAIQMATEWEAFRSDPDYIEGLIDFDVVQSFTTRGYSEVRTTAGRGAVALQAAAKNLLHPWPALNKLMNDMQNPAKSGGGSGDVPTVGAPGLVGSPQVRWDTGRYIIDAGRPGFGAPYSVYDERPGGQWFVPGLLEAWWPS